MNMIVMLNTKDESGADAIIKWANDNKLLSGIGNAIKEVGIQDVVVKRSGTKIWVNNPERCLIRIGGLGRLVQDKDVESTISITPSNIDIAIGIKLRSKKFRKE